MKPKILHVYKTFLPDSYGGVEQCIYQLCRNEQVESKVFCLSKSPATTLYENIEVVRYPISLDVASCPISFKALLDFRKLSEWADVIHYHYPWPFADLLSIFAHKRKSIVTYHSDIVKQKFLRALLYPLEQWFLSRVDKIVSTSPHYSDTSYNLLKYKNKVEVITIGLEDKRSSNITKEDYGKYFLFIGQLRYYKGLHILLEAMVGSAYNLVIAGGGGQYKDLYSIKQRLHLDNVIFLGQVDDQKKADLLANCYAVILPSHLRSEALGLALVEGAMFGRPLISCAMGTGTDYININEKTGYTVAPNNPSLLRSAMDKLIADPNQAKQMGISARKRYEEVFSAKVMREKYSNLISKL